MGIQSVYTSRMNALSFTLPKPTKFSGRNSYYFYLRIPHDLAQNYPASKKFIKKSLRTEDLREAKSRMLAVGLAVEQEFQELRRRNKIAEAKAQAIQHTQEKESTRRSATLKKALLLSKAQYRTPFTQVSESELAPAYALPLRSPQAG
jgi:hypothetical protein